MNLLKYCKSEFVELASDLWRKIMGKKKVEHVVFDGMRKIKKQFNISEYNKKSHIEKRKRIEEIWTNKS